MGYTSEKRKKLKLEGKTVVITGASSGAGRAAAGEFAKYGAQLVLAARRADALNAVEAECRELGAVAIAIPTDTSDAEAVKQLAQKAAELSGAIDVWINNAGVLAAGEFDVLPIEIHEQVIKTNLLGYLNGAHASLPYFKEQGHGILINNISVGGWFPVPYGASYSASKFGLIGFAEALRGEVSRWRNIHVCDLYPAFLDTPGIQHAANYTGKILRPAPPVYDPRKVAKAMVHTAMYPRNKVVIDAFAPLLKMVYGLFPRLTSTTTLKSFRVFLKTN